MKSKDYLAFTTINDTEQSVRGFSVSVRRTGDDHLYDHGAKASAMSYKHCRNSKGQRSETV